MCVSEPVAVLQAMGRKSGFITAASRLGDPRREMPLQLYMAETHHTLHEPAREREPGAAEERPVHRRGERGLRRGRRGRAARRVRPHRVRRQPHHRGAGGRELPQREGACRARPGHGPAAGCHPALGVHVRLHGGHRGGARSCAPRGDCRPVTTAPAGWPPSSGNRGRLQSLTTTRCTC